MPARIRRHLTFANTIALIALFVALGGTSVGAPVRDKTTELASRAAASVGIGKRAQKASKRALRIAKRADRNAKAALARSTGNGDAGARGDTGAKGEPGTKGDKGDTGEPAEKLWAVVNSNGDLQRSDGVFDSTRTSAGNYKVYFEIGVRNCSYQATPGGPGVLEPENLGTAFASVSSDPILLNGVSVAIRNSLNANNAIDFPFHIAVSC